MSSQTQAVKNYLAAFELLEKQNNGQETNVHPIRKEAIKTFAETGFPGKKNENWRFTDLSGLLAVNFKPGHPAEADKDLQTEIERNLFRNWDGVQLVFVDGYFMDEFSQIPETTDDIQISTLAGSADISFQSAVFGKTQSNGDDAFGLLNTALARDGVSVRVKKNNVAPAVHIISLQTKKAESSFSMLKNTVHLEQGSTLQLIETFVALEDSVYFTNSSLTVTLDENSRCTYYKMQNESRNATHISTLKVVQGRDSVFHSNVLDFGGGLVRNNLMAILNGEGAETVLNGLYLGRGNQHMDNHTVIAHAVPHCNSSELYQGILTDQSRGVFSGMIHVHRDAQKTDARQSNNCLLLSEEAKIDSKPQLEIYADDVQCTHGATVGQLNEEEIFYLRSRGIGKVNARNILTYAFAEKIIEHIEIPELKERAEMVFQNKLGEELKIY